MKVPDVIGLWVFATLAAAPAVAQQHHLHDPSPNSGDFLRRAREGTARYHDRAHAIADGFRPQGPDAPAMGQHWVHPGRVLSGVFDPARPAGLTYIMVGDRPTLTGLVYILPLGQGMPPPEGPAGAAAWHFHNGDLSQEALLSVHDPAQGDSPGLQIAVLHAWVWAENPDGPFAAENWSLPYTRLGLPAPGVTPRAAKAVSLATAEGRSFFASRIRLATAGTVPDVDRVLLAYGDRVRDRLTKPGAPGVTARDLRWLEETWHGAVRDLLALLAAEDRLRMRGLLDDSAPRAKGPSARRCRFEQGSIPIRARRVTA